MRQIRGSAALFFMLVALSWAAVATTRSRAKPLRVCDGLGAVYGLAFANSGELLATGKDGNENVIWSIDKIGKASRYVKLVDPADALSVIGVSVHSRFPADMTVDEAGNLFIATEIDAGAFVVTAQKMLRKIYLNTEYSVSVQEKDPPHGVLYDASESKLHLVTMGPESRYSTTQVTHLTTLAFERTKGDYQGFYAGEEPDIRFVHNDGVPLAFKPVALAKAPGSGVYCIARHAVYRVDGGTPALIKKFDDVSLWGATTDEARNLYLAANEATYSPQSGQGKGQIIKIAPKGTRSIVTSEIKEPLGMAFTGGRLYIADRATGSIWSLEP